MTLEQRRNDGIDLRVRDEGTDRTAVRPSRFPPPPDQTPWAHRPGATRSANASASWAASVAARFGFSAEDVSARHGNGCGPNIGRNAEVQMRIRDSDRRGSHRDAIPFATGVRLGEVHAHCCVARQAKGKRSYPVVTGGNAFTIRRKASVIRTMVLALARMVTVWRLPIATTGTFLVPPVATSVTVQRAPAGMSLK